MPTYPYVCKNCDYSFEKYQSFSEDSLTLCPECSQHSLRKVFGSVGGVHFRGAGFYSTDSSAASTSSQSGE